MLMTKLLSRSAFGALMVLVGAPAFGAEVQPVDRPTFYKDVLPVLQENCQLCHRAKGANFGGMVAPMALEEYQQVRPWAKAMAKVVSQKTMPPWSAHEQHHGEFRNERTLTDDAIGTLVRWADIGAPRGSADDAPAPVTWPENEAGWMIGEPDLIVKMPEPYFVADDVDDLYVDFETTLTPDILPEDRWIKAVEFRGGSGVVHHIIARPLGGMAPGYDPVLYEEGYSRKLEAGSTINWEMHYHKEPGPGTGVWDQSEAAIIFWPEGTVIEHVVETEPLGAFNFVIPAGDANYAHEASFTFAHDSLILGYNPHMHLRGSSAKYVAKYPDGREETLLWVPKYDFNWQITYSYAEPKRVPKGTQVHLTTTWDNSADNPANPDPTKTVRWGRPTTDEMMFGWMRYTDVEPKRIVVGAEESAAAGGDAQTD